MRPTWTRFLIVLATVFLALPAPALVRASFLCHVTGKVSKTHCCKHAQADVHHTQVKQRDCCEVQPAHVQATATATRISPQDLQTVAWIPIAAFAPLPRGTSIAAHAPAPVHASASGPPRFLLHCALLI